MSQSNIRPSDRRVSSDFISLSIEVAEFARKAGSYLVPFHDVQLPHFNRLTPDKKEEVLAGLKNLLSWLSVAEASSGPMDSNKHVLWHFIKSQDMVLRSDLMDKITDDDVIEVHTLDGLYQIFTSFSFYSKSSYTIEEICSYPWHELYEVEPETRINIFNLAKDIIEGRITETYNPKFKKYIVKELKSVFRYEVEVTYHLVSPLFDRAGRPVAAVSVETLNVLNKQISPSTKQKMINEHFGLGADLHLAD